MNPKWSEPYFDISVPNNVTALVGKSAYLSCRVRNLGNKTVRIYKFIFCVLCITFHRNLPCEEIILINFLVSFPSFPKA